MYADDEKMRSSLRGALLRLERDLWHLALQLGRDEGRGLDLLVDVPVDKIGAFLKSSKIFWLESSLTQASSRNFDSYNGKWVRKSDLSQGLTWIDSS